MNKFEKFLKAIPYIIIAVLVFLYVHNRSVKSSKDRDDTYYTLLSMAEDLHMLSGECYDAFDSDDFDTMQEILYSAYETCESLSDQAEKLSDKFEEPEYEENTRSWWY